jgi:cell division protein ZapA (FtsZ GTPase activity inhibitor)
MVTPQQPVEVEVFGQRFALRSEKSAEKVRQIAAYVDHQLRQVAEQARTPVLLRVAIMAALTIADEYHTTAGHLDTPRSG